MIRGLNSDEAEFLDNANQFQNDLEVQQWQREIEDVKNYKISFIIHNVHVVKLELNDDSCVIQVCLLLYDIYVDVGKLQIHVISI